MIEAIKELQALLHEMAARQAELEDAVFWLRIVVLVVLVVIAHNAYLTKNRKARG